MSKQELPAIIDGKVVISGDAFMSAHLAAHVAAQDWEIRHYGEVYIVQTKSRITPDAPTQDKMHMWLFYSSEDAYRKLREIIICAALTAAGIKVQP